MIAGGTGFLGRNLARHLGRMGCEVVVISRHSPEASHDGQHVRWDARTLGDWVRHLDGASALVNLTGRTVDCVKTPEHCDEILRSRVESTAVLGLAIKQLDSPPRVWVQMGTAHRYGDPPEVVKSLRIGPPEDPSNSLGPLIVQASISLGILDESDLYVFEPAGVRTVRLERNHRGASGMFECSLFLVDSPRDLSPYLAGD